MKGVFSTSVEVFLTRVSLRSASPRLLHVRGGVSTTYAVFKGATSVFSTSVEVFPPSVIVLIGSFGLLHVRGGVSAEGCTVELAP